MRSASLYRASGNCLMYAGLLWAIGIVLMPRGPMATLGDLRILAGPAWIASALLMILGVALGLSGMLGLYRHFAGGEQEGWALLFLGTAMLGMVLSVVANAVSGIGIPVLLQLASGAADPATLEPAAAGLVTFLAAVYNVDNLLNGLAFVPLGVAMLRDHTWPRWLAWGCLVYALVVVVAPFALIPRDTMTAPGTSTPFRLTLLLGFAFVVVLGAMVARLGRVPAAPVAEEVGAGV